MSFESLIRRSGMPLQFTKLEGYYEGTVTLDSLGVSLPPQVRVLEQVAPFPKFAVDVLAEVLNPEGFTLASSQQTPDLLRRWWQANNLDTAVKLAIVEALVQGQSFLIVGPGTGDIPRITAHRRAGMAVEYDHMGEVSAAVRRYKSGGEAFAAHYLPGETLYYQHVGGDWVEVPGSRVTTGASRPAVVPLTNKARLGDVNGRSEILEIATTTDAASRSLTNLQVAQELLAMPTRYVFADGAESPDSMEKALKSYFGHFITGPSDGKAGQIPGADLSQIVNTYKLYAQIISSVTGIPPSMLGISTDNPSSAEAMRVAKDRLIARAEVKQSMFGDPIEDTARLALEMQGQKVAGLETLELQWRDPALTSASAKSANILQAHAQGVVSAQTARDYLQLTPEQKAREDARGDAVSGMRNQMGA
ncbi:hypothetical protein DEO23_14065 [Brachybacterium endophyticum]|uniref:Phage portal protein n=1 Tax=Brachybacterium endophyticum TaxID=2182385 RepID=A0A2U2RH49_9MICO|nr:phage portal protein [Brachybacterium endophyticum]PWH05202.1 hypothetical protein DEO23_14065 [Brachybacterium endophyticum]